MHTKRAKGEILLRLEKPHCIFHQYAILLIWCHDLYELDNVAFQKEVHNEG